MPDWLICLFVSLFTHSLMDPLRLKKSLQPLFELSWIWQVLLRCILCNLINLKRHVTDLINNTFTKNRTKRVRDYFGLFALISANNFPLNRCSWTFCLELRRLVTVCPFLHLRPVMDYFLFPSLTFCIHGWIIALSGMSPISRMFLIPQFQFINPKHKLQLSSFIVNWNLLKHLHDI